MNPQDAVTGMRLAKMGRFAEALPYLDAANRIAPTDIPLLHAVASVLQWAGYGVDAADRYQVAAGLLPDNTIVLTGWARSLLLIGKPDQALPLLDRAVQIDAQYADGGGLLDMLLWEGEDADAACLILKPLIELHPSHAGLALQYAKALMAAEHLDDARAAYEIYQKLSPEDPLASVELGRLAASRGDIARPRRPDRSPANHRSIARHGRNGATFRRVLRASTPGFGFGGQNIQASVRASRRQSARQGSRAKRSTHYGA